MDTDMILEGAISVKAALEAKRRSIYEIITDGRRPDRNRSYILALAKNAGIPIRTRSSEEISVLAGGTSHGGLLARAGERIYSRASDLFAQKTPFLLFWRELRIPTTSEAPFGHSTPPALRAYWYRNEIGALPRES